MTCRQSRLFSFFEYSAVSLLLEEVSYTLAFLFPVSFALPSNIFLFRNKHCHFVVSSCCCCASPSFFQDFMKTPASAIFSSSCFFRGSLGSIKMPFKRFTFQGSWKAIPLPKAKHTAWVKDASAPIQIHPASNGTKFSSHCKRSNRSTIFLTVQAWMLKVNTAS